MFNYESVLSEKVKEMKPSGIRKFFDLLGDMNDVVALTVGQPDFLTPWHIRDAGIASLEKGYTRCNGISCSEGICCFFKRVYGKMLLCD